MKKAGKKRRYESICVPVLLRPWLGLNSELTKFKEPKEGWGSCLVLDLVSGRRLHTLKLGCTIAQADILKFTNPVLRIKKYCKGQGDPNGTGWSGQLNPGTNGGGTIDPGAAAMKNRKQIELITVRWLMFLECFLSQKIKPAVNYSKGHQQGS